MPNFVDDLGALPFPKTDKTALPAGEDATKHVQATDWNALCQAAVDLRGAASRAVVASLRDAFEAGIPPRIVNGSAIGPGSEGTVFVPWEAAANESLGAEFGARFLRPTNIGQVDTVAAFRYEVHLAHWATLGFRFKTAIDSNSSLYVALDTTGDGLVDAAFVASDNQIVQDLARLSNGTVDSAWKSVPLSPGWHTVMVVYACGSTSDTLVAVDSFTVSPVEHAFDGMLDDFIRGTDVSPVDPLLWTVEKTGDQSLLERLDGEVPSADERGVVRILASDATSAAGIYHSIKLPQALALTPKSRPFIEARFTLRNHQGIVVFGTADGAVAHYNPNGLDNGAGHWWLAKDAYGTSPVDCGIAGADCYSLSNYIAIRLETTPTGVDMYFGYEGNYSGKKQLVRVASIADAALDGRVFFKVETVAGYEISCALDYIRVGWQSRFHELAEHPAGGVG